jgi:ribonucleotide reductase alpha subunit
MRLGIPYDSDQGRAICGALTAIMCGHAYATSAEMAAAKGAFAGFQRTAIAMLRVMNKHRDAAYNAADGDPEAGSPCPRAINAEGAREPLAAAREDWDLALARSARSTATATRRARCSRPPAPSACSWTATPPASSPTSRS